MKVIIEGADLSGKTYAIERIAKKFNSGFIIKNAYKPKSAEDSTKIYKQYWDIVDCIKRYNKDALVILDRFFPSQAVYSILREVDEMKHPQIQFLEQYCKDTNYKYIYLDTPLKVLEERYDKRGDEHIKKEQLLMLKERYDTFFELCTLDKIKINTLDEDWLTQVENFIEEKE